MKEKTLLLIGADGGLGNGMISYFLQQDYNSLYLSGRKEFPAPDDHRITKIFTGSLDSDEAVAELFSQIPMRKRTQLYVFSTIGGYMAGQPADETPPHVWDSMLSMNLMTTTKLIPQFVRKATEGAGGAICFMSALSAFRNEENRSAYSVSKAALNQLVVSAAPELKRKGTSIFAIAPFLINTPANQEWMDQEMTNLAVTPEEVAATAHSLFQQYHILSGNIIRIEHRFRIDDMD